MDKDYTQISWTCRQQTDIRCSASLNTVVASANNIYNLVWGWFVLWFHSVD